MLEKIQSDQQALKRIPVYVLVGFLGSGKTTTLSELIGWSLDQGLKPGLIINEFGEISIDGEAVRAEGLALTELTNGCVCCTAGEELVPAIQELARRGDLDLIFVEATGIADPADMLDELTDPFLLEQVEVGGIISVLDAKRFTELSDQIDLVRRQVIFADVLVMNKCDLITEEWRDTLLVTLPKLAPHARIFLAEGGLPTEGVAALLIHAQAVGREHLGAKAISKTQHDSHHPHEHNERDSHTHEHDDDHHHHDSHTHEHEHEHHDHDGHEHEHHHGLAHESIHTASFALDKPLVRAQFNTFLESLPRTIYRAKGFVTFVGDEQPYVFQYVPDFVFIKPFPLQNKSRLRGVFIGRSLEKESLEAQLRQCESAEVQSSR